MPYDPLERTPDLRINVSLGEFHQTHQDASDGKALLAEGLDKLSDEQLQEILARLQAAQRLTDAETGSDAMYATNYRLEMGQVTTELEYRKT